MKVQRYGLALTCAAALVALAGTAASASPAGSKPGAEPMAAISALRAHVVQCGNGSTIRVLTPPAGRRMPITALMRNHSPKLVRQERARTRWLVPGCQSNGHWGNARVLPDGTVPATEEVDSANWSGFQTTATGFTFVEAQWNVPSVGSDGPTVTSSIWPGLGDGNSNRDILVQAGTEQDADASPEIGGSFTYVYYAWYEIVPLEYQQTLTGFTVNPGDEMYVSVDHSGSGQALIDVDDSTLNESSTFYVTWGTQYTLSADAEWIVERTEFDKVYPPLAEFAPVTISTAEATDSAGTTAGVADYHRDFFWMMNCAFTEYLAKTGNISGQDTFPVSWQNYGPDNPDDPAGC
jgi:Peptidase A4 family